MATLSAEAVEACCPSAQAGNSCGQGIRQDVVRANASANAGANARQSPVRDHLRAPVVAPARAGPYLDRCFTLEVPPITPIVPSTGGGRQWGRLGAPSGAPSGAAPGTRPTRTPGAARSGLAEDGGVRMLNCHTTRPPPERRLLDLAPVRRSVHTSRSRPTSGALRSSGVKQGRHRSRPPRSRPWVRGGPRAPDRGCRGMRLATAVERSVMIIGGYAPTKGAHRAETHDAPADRRTRRVPAATDGRGRPGRSPVVPGHPGIDRGAGLPGRTRGPGARARPRRAADRSRPVRP